MEKISLKVRNATKADIKEIKKLCTKVYTWSKPYSLNILKSQILNFPEGQFVAELNNKIVGYCASIIVTEKEALEKHNWRTITGDGYASTHNPKGEYLYGIEIFVDTELRGKRIGDRLYRQRKELCKKYNLKGIVLGGRIPSLSKKIKKYKTPEQYLEKIQNKEAKDPVISFQQRQGFQILGLL